MTEWKYNNGDVEMYNEEGNRLVAFIHVLDLLGRDYPWYGDQTMTLKEEFDYTMKKNNRTPSEAELNALDFFLSRELSAFDHIALTDENRHLLGLPKTQEPQ